MQKDITEEIELGDYASIFLSGPIDNIIAYLKSIRDQAKNLGYKDIIFELFSIDDIVPVLKGTKIRK